MASGEPDPGGTPAKSRSKRKPLLLGALALLLLAGGGAGAWSAGLLPFGRHADEAPASHPPVFVEIPEIVANLNSTARRPVYVKLRARLEMSRPDDAAAAQTAMPRLLDLFNTFLRETRPEELRGSAGVHRLREELISRANIALREGSVIDVLFVELVVQ